MILAGSTIEYYIPIIAGTILFGLLSAFIVSFILQYRKTQDRFAVEKEQLTQALLRAEIEIKEQTLTNVSREIHDNFGQVASLIKINLNLLSGELSESDRQKVDESLILIKQLVVDMKSLSRSLNGESLQKLGWVKTMQAEIERINRLANVKVSLSVVGETRDLAHDEQVILYRVVQEILNNLLKHAYAAHAQITLSYTADQLTLSYVDDGCGFDSTISQNEGSGLTNMRERCRQIGANFELTSSIGQGTQIVIIV